MLTLSCSCCRNCNSNSRLCSSFSILQSRRQKQQHKLQPRPPYRTYPYDSFTKRVHALMASNTANDKSLNHSSPTFTLRVSQAGLVLLCTEAASPASCWRHHSLDNVKDIQRRLLRSTRSNVCAGEYASMTIAGGGLLLESRSKKRSERM